MYEHVLPEVLNAYGIKYQRIFEYQKGYRNEIWPVLTADGQMLNVTFYKREAGIVARIHRSNAVSEYLALRGLPTRQRFDNRILSLASETSKTHVGVYGYLPGETIPWEAYTMAHIKLLGMTMSNMHSLLSSMPISGISSVYDEYLSIIARMRAYFTEPAVQNAIMQKLNITIKPELLDVYNTLLRQYRTLSNQQVLHMDFVRGNILFSKATPEHSQKLNKIAISGILDFEKTATGHPVVEIARTLAFLLVDCKYKSSDKVEKYFLRSGYQKRGMAKDVGDDATRNQLVEMFLMYDLYKFLRHNPYESLHLNEHYERTKDMLVKRGVIFYL